MSENTLPKLFRVLIIDDKVGNSPEYQEIVSAYLLHLLWTKDNSKDFSLDVRYAATPEEGIAFWQREVFDLTLVDSDFTKNESSRNKTEEKRSFLDLDIKFTGAYLYRFLREMQESYAIAGDKCKVFLWTGLRKERNGKNQWEILCNLVCLEKEPEIILKQYEDGIQNVDWDPKKLKPKLVTLQNAFEESIFQIKTDEKEKLARIVTAYRTKSPEEFYELCKDCINGLNGCVVDGYVYIDDKHQLCYSRNKPNSEYQIYLSPKLRDNTSLSVLFRSMTEKNDNSVQLLEDNKVKQLILREEDKPCLEVPTPPSLSVLSSPAKQVIAAGTPLTGVSATGRTHAIQVMKEKMKALLDNAFSKVVLKTIYLDYLPADDTLKELHWPQLQIQSQHRARCLRSTGHPRTLWNTGKTALESLTPQMLNEYLKAIKTETYRDRVIVSLGSKYPQATKEDLSDDLKSMGITNANTKNHQAYRNSQGTFDEDKFVTDVTTVWQKLFETVYKDLYNDAPPWVEINVRHYLRECVNYNIGGNEYLSPDSVDGKMPLGNGYDNLKREFSLWLKIIDKIAAYHRKKLILKLPFRGDLLFFLKIILDFKMEKELCASCQDKDIPAILTVCKNKREYYKKNYCPDTLQYGVQGINLINAFKSAVCESAGGVPYSPAWYGRTDAWFGDASKKTAKYQMSGEMLNASRNELLHAVLKAVEGRGIELHLGGGVVSQEDIRFLQKYKPLKATTNPNTTCKGKCPTCGSSRACTNGAIAKEDAEKPKVYPDMCIGCGACISQCNILSTGKPSLILDSPIKIQIGTWGLLDLNLSRQTWTKCDNTPPSIGAGRPTITKACKQCTPCQIVCPHGAFKQQSGGNKPDIDITTCVNCKQCLTQCPNGAVQLSATGVEVPFEEPKSPPNLGKDKINFRFAFWLHELCNGCGRCSRTFYCDSFLDRRGLDWQPLMDTRNCTGCGLCVQTCPHGALQLFAPEHYAVLIGNDDKKEALMAWHRCMTARQIPHFVYTEHDLNNAITNPILSKKKDLYSLWMNAVENDGSEPVKECPVIIVEDENKASLHHQARDKNITMIKQGTLNDLLQCSSLLAIVQEVQRRLANLREK